MVLFSLLSLCGALTGPASIARCRCVAPKPITTPRLAGEFLAETHAAFRGRVISFRPALDTIGKDALTLRPMTTSALDFTVAIGKWWGGTGFDTVHVVTASEATMCGADLIVGEEYLFLSYNHHGNRVGVSSCLAPRKPYDVADLIRLLDSAEVLQKGRRQ
jgi:hypothetical protein